MTRAYSTSQATAVLGLEDIPALCEGASFYTPALGNANMAVVAAWVSGLLGRHGPVELLSPDAVDPATTAVAVCFVGSGSCLADLPPTGEEFVAAVHQVERSIGSTVGAIYGIAAGTVSALSPVATAAQLEVPLIDADGMGRVYALIHHTAMHLGGLAPGPLVLYGANGECVTVDVPYGPRIDPLVRAAVDTLGGWAALVGYPTTVAELATSALQGTLSRLLHLGRLLLERVEVDQLLAHLAGLAGSRRIARGRIVELEHLSRPDTFTMPAHPSTLVLLEQGDRRRQVRIELRNEIVAVFCDGDLVSATPDVVCLLDVASRGLAALDSLALGDLVDVIVTPADPIWYTAQGSALVGLHAHGIQLEHPGPR